MHCAYGTTANVIDCIASIEHHLLPFHSFFFFADISPKFIRNRELARVRHLLDCVCVRCRNFHFYDIFGLLSFEFLYALKLHVDINLHTNAYYIKIVKAYSLLSAGCANTLLSYFFLNKNKKINGIDLLKCFNLCEVKRFTCKFWRRCSKCHSLHLLFSRVWL